MPTTRSPWRTLACVLVAAAAAAAQDTLLLDDFDDDNTDELLGDQGLLAIFFETQPLLTQDEDFASTGDVGAVLYDDPDAADTLVAGQYPNDAGAVGASLGLSFTDLGIIGFEFELRNASASFVFGLGLEDDGPSGTVERRVAAADIVVPAGDSVTRTLFTDDDWFLEPGFDFTEIRAIFYGLNNEPRRPGRPRPIDALSVEFVEFRAILADPCPADLDGDGELTLFDFLAFQNLFDAGDPIADFDGDGSLTLFDFLAFQNAFAAGCP
ncbi:MAG: GC-type dockerin domain-anchored protein [Planctomycetota bacterium]